MFQFGACAPLRGALEFCFAKLWARLVWDVRGVGGFRKLCVCLGTKCEEHSKVWALSLHSKLQRAR